MKVLNHSHKKIHNLKLVFVAYQDQDASLNLMEGLSFLRLLVIKIIFQHCFMSEVRLLGWPSLIDL